MEDKSEAVIRADFRTKKELAWFFGMTFGIMYGLGGLAMIFRAQIERVTGPLSNSNIFVMILIYAPTISALVLTGIGEGKAGYKALFGRAISSRSFIWWLVSIAVLPAIFGVCGLAALVLGFDAIPFSPSAFLSTFPLLVFSLNLFTDAGPLGEELGWRGYALPRLLRLLSPIGATTMLAGFWTLFHGVAFLSEGTTQFGMSFVWFTASCFGISFIMSWLFMRSGGNWVIAGVIPHYLFNSFMGRGTLPVGPASAVALWIPVVIIILTGGFKRDKRVDPRLEPNK